MDSLVDSHNELSVKNKEAERYFYMSFKFSQGSADLQSHLHRWAKINGYFDSVEDPPENFFEKLKTPRDHETISPHLKFDFEMEWNIMAGIFNSTDEIPIVGPESIMFEMVDRDLKYVRSGRPLSEASAGDKHSSFIRDYVVFGRPTGMKVYDDLFDKMKPTLKENLEDHDIKMLVKEWETKHPGQTFFPEHWNP